MFRTIDFNIKTLYNFQHIGGINCMRSIKLCLKWGGEQNMISLKAKTNYSANNIQPIDRKVIPTEFKILFIVLLLLANYVMAPRYSFATNHPKYKSYNQQSSKNKSVKPTNKLNKIKNINTTKKVGPIKHKTHNTTIKKKSKKQKAHKIKPENSNIKPKIFEAKTETAEIKQEMPIDKINNAPKKAIRNNVISEEDIKYYQKEIGDKYKITNTTGRSGYCAIAYELEDKDRNKFVLKIPRDPSNTEYWIKRQKSAEEKIKKYYQNHQRTLKITNYITIGKNFVIEKNWGEQIGKEDFWNSLPKEKTSEFINGMAEFLKFTHSQSVGNVSPIRLDHDQFTFKDAVNYLDEANAINSEEKI